MKSIRTLLLPLLLAALFTVSAHAASYSDVPKNNWAYDTINRATELNLISGVGNGKFGLGQKLTRAEYAVMLCRVMDWDLLTPAEGSFTDNRNPKEWYYSAVETAYAHGALRKVGDKAGVQETLTREELTAMTVRALGYATLAAIVQDDCPFTDVSTNAGYIALAYHTGLVTGIGKTTFFPAKLTNREEATAILLRIYDALHADIASETVSAPGAGAVVVEPLNDRDGRIPICPRAPLEGVYEAALRAGRGGAVALHTAPYNATADRTLRAAELRSLLSSSSSRVYRSSRYESSYLTRSDRVVWFEAEEDIAAKLTLCRLMGINTVYLLQS